MAATRWFWLSLLTVLAWAGWALLLKVVADQLPGETALLLQTVGMVPVLLWLLWRQARAAPQPYAGGRTGTRGTVIASEGASRTRGIVYALLIGAVTGIGIVFMLAAYRRGGNAAVVSVSTSLYPLVSCALALLVLREKLTVRQWCGLALSLVAIVLFAL